MYFWGGSVKKKTISWFRCYKIPACITAFSKLNYGKQVAVGRCQQCTVLQRKRGREGDKLVI